ncbi:STAS domain-containing protein [Hydrogenophaga sp.]|jgi:phospholipid transport system transporter-binding protein|uniref:STAS domain-containing protein n=2 Tax=unclassified Hydrogenophaga TaxID=2610897 RepID=UPI0026C53D18
MPEHTMALPERLTLEEAVPTLQRLDGQLAHQPDGTVVLDATSLREFDSSALAVLLELRRRLQTRGKGLRVEGWPPRLQDLAGLYGVQELLAST